MDKCNVTAYTGYQAGREDAGREMRRVINFQNKWCSKEEEVSQRHERRDEGDWARRQSRRECDARKAANVKMFMSRNIWSVVILAITCVLDLFCLIDFWVCLAIVSLISGYLVLNFMAYATRNLVDFEEMGNTVCAKP